MNQRAKNLKHYYVCAKHSHLVAKHSHLVGYAKLHEGGVVEQEVTRPGLVRGFEGTKERAKCLPGFSADVASKVGG